MYVMAIVTVCLHHHLIIIQSSPTPQGEFLFIRAKFPTEDKVEPGLNLRVRDKRLGANPIIGVATLSPLPSKKGGGPTKEELEAENDAWAFMGKKMGSEGTISSASIADGLSELTATDDGNKPAKKVEKAADDDDDDDIDPVALLAAANAAEGGESADPHGMGATPAYLVGRDIFPGPLEDQLGPPPFITAPVYRIGFQKEEKEVVGEVRDRVLCCCAVVLCFMLCWYRCSAVACALLSS